jgi:hypothetical protein
MGVMHGGLWLLDVAVNRLNTKWKMYEACPESKDTKVLNMHNIFNLQKATL